MNVFSLHWLCLQRARLKDYVICRRSTAHRLVMARRKADGSKVVIEVHGFIIVHDYDWRQDEKASEIMDALYPPDEAGGDEWMEGEQLGM